MFNEARQVFSAFPSLDEDVPEPGDTISPIEFADALRSGQDYSGAVMFLSHALPKPEAVWWGVRCVAGLTNALGAVDEELLALSEAWVREGDEEQRLAALEAAEAPKNKSAAAWIAYGAGWSSGSMSTSSDYQTLAPPDLTAKAVNAGIMFAAAQLTLADRGRGLDLCVAHGLEFARGGTMQPLTLAAKLNDMAY